MTTIARQWMDSFQALPDSDKEELAAQILRWLTRASHRAPNDGELLEAADAVFLALDAAEERSASG